jgi:hypothetical protein
VQWIRALVAAAAVAALTLAPNLALAGDGVPDPRAYCDHVAELMVEADLNALVQDIPAHTNRSGTAADIDAGLSNLQPFWSKAGAVQANEHISEQKLGDNYVRHWYVLTYDLGPLFMRCTMYRPGSSWLVLSLDYSDKPDTLGQTK